MPRLHHIDERLDWIDKIIQEILLRRQHRIDIVTGGAPEEEREGADGVNGAECRSGR